MIVFPRGEVRTWSDLTPGALFGVFNQRRNPLRGENSGQRYRISLHCLEGIAAALRARKRSSKFAALFLPKQQNSYACNSALMVRGHSRVRSSRVPKGFSSFFRGSNPIRVRSSGWKGSRGGSRLCSHSGVEDCPPGSRRTRSHFRMAR